MVYIDGYGVFFRKSRNAPNMIIMLVGHADSAEICRIYANFRESLSQALEALSDHPRRVVASSLGVFWGAAAIVLLMAGGAGFREYMKIELGSFGRGLVMMYPASTSSGFPGYRKGVRVEIEAIAYR